MTEKTKIKAPKHLRAATRRWFESVLTDYQLEAHHIRLLQLAGESWDRCQEAREALKKHGMTFENKYGETKIRPEAIVEKDSRIAFARLIRELNLSEEPPDPPRPNPLRYGGPK
jgi:phage terminase small subunit